MNELKLYFGDDYEINQFIRIRQPRLDDIIRMGEEEYFQMVWQFITIPSDIKPLLFDEFGVIWEDISEFDLFLTLLLPGITSEHSKLLFGDLDFTKFSLGYNYSTEEHVLIQKVLVDGQSQEVVLDRLIYTKITDALRIMHGIKKKEETAASKVVQKLLIDDDRRKQERERRIREKEGVKSTLLPLISTLVNCSDFKYDLESVRTMPIYAFMDSVSRIQIVRNTTALMQGCYSGMIDSKKIDKNELNMMREIKKSQ